MASPYVMLIVQLLVVSICFGPIQGNNWEPCGDWIQYNDEKCFKILDDTLRTFDEAKDACVSQEQTSTLAVIRSSEEQQFLSDYLFKTEQKVENFWIGAKYSSQNGSFVWNDNSQLNYTNWDSTQGPRSLENHCVHMQADVSGVGKWKDGRCDKKNAVVCQMMQFWTIDFLQKTVIDLRRQQRDKIRELTQSFESANQRINDQKQNFEQRINEVSSELIHIKQNPVPIGFIYVQLPHQPEPKTLWSTVQWQDVTSEYSGLFFRAEGTNATAFGIVQEENAPRVTQVRFGYFATDQGINNWKSTNLIAGDWSSGIGVLSGSWTGKDIHTHQFHQSGGEIRPRNMAMRFWKRI